MKTSLAFILLVFSLTSAQAATIETRIFSFEVPNQWTVENNETNIVLAFGSEMFSEMPSPFLSVQYCASDNPVKASSQGNCQSTCEQEASDLASGSSMKKGSFSPTTKIKREDGTTEFKAEFAESTPSAGFFALLCGNRGQVHIGFISGSPREAAKEQFLKILGSLKWK